MEDSYQLDFQNRKTTIIAKIDNVKNDMQLKTNALFSERLTFDVKQYMEFLTQQSAKLASLTSISSISALDSEIDAKIEELYDKLGAQFRILRQIKLNALQ